MQVRVAPLGEQVQESSELGVYLLPQTVLKVEMIFQETKSVPGPFREYAEKYLGIKEVIRQNSSQWQIHDLELTSSPGAGSANGFPVTPYGGRL